jgi:hypothetical protein
MHTNISQQPAASVISKDDGALSSEMSLDGFHSQSGYSKAKYPLLLLGMKRQSTTSHYTKLP